MARGGKREGAGRKPGAITKATRLIAEQGLGEGLSPLEYMLGVMRNNDNALDVRFEAAKASAPYMHARLSAIDAHHSGKVDLGAALDALADVD